jgi:hypothetical protein
LTHYPGDPSPTQDRLYRLRDPKYGLSRPRVPDGGGGGVGGTGYLTQSLGAACQEPLGTGVTDRGTWACQKPRGAASLDPGPRYRRFTGDNEA